MQRNNFPLGEGGEEGSEEGSEEKSCEHFLSILTFSREKSVLTKVVLYDARSLKKNRFKIIAISGGSHDPNCDNYRTFFSTLTPSLIINYLLKVWIISKFEQDLQARIGHYCLLNIKTEITCMQC